MNANIRPLISRIQRLPTFPVLTSWLTINLSILVLWKCSYLSPFTSMSLAAFSLYVLLILLFLRIRYLSDRHTDDQAMRSLEQVRQIFARRDSTSLQNFARDLSDADETLLCNQWGLALATDCNPAHLRYLANGIRQLEASSQGRLACHIQDALIHILIAESLAIRGRVSYLEIGCLFGLNVMTIILCSRLFTDDIHATMIDPLDGYYESGYKDPYTGIPVSRKIVAENFRSHFIDKHQYRIIQELSNHERALREASDRRYNYIFIDGDHSYDGVMRDYDNYAPLLEAGGYLVIDDYGNQAWPDVTRFVDDRLMSSDTFQLIGHGWKTVVFQKKRDTEKQ
jgi:hypothetical protein